MTRSLPITAALCSLAFAAPAVADVRHASPTGSGSSCTSAAPCLLEEALDHAHSGDEVVVHAGIHNAAGAGEYELGDKANLDVHGAAGEVRPEIRTAGTSCGIFVGPSSHVHDLKLRLDGAVGEGLCADGGSTVERLSITSTATGVTGIALLQASGSIARDISISVTGDGSDGVNVTGASGAHLRNLSVVADDAAVDLSGGPSGGTASVRNSYLDGGLHDLRLTCPSAFTVDLARNALGGYFSTTPSCNVTQSAPNADASGADVALVDGILRAGSGSTLHDAGARDSETGAADVEGDPRELGSKVDVGADERRVAPTVVSTGASQVTDTGARLAGFLQARGASVSAVFQYGTTTSYGQTVAAAGGAAKAIIDLDLHGVSAMVGGLAPTTTYHFRIKATNQFGQVAYGPDRTFTTAATLPPAPPAESPADPGTTPPPTGTVDPGGAVVAPAADRAAPRCTAKLVRTLRRGRATLSGRCSEAATLRVTIAGRLAAKVRVPAGTFRRTIKVGTLRPGRRIVRIVARDVAGNSAAALRLALKPRR